MELENILLIVILCFLILYTITHIKVITPPTPPYPYPIGGCSGTRYGCCPDNVNAKHDTVGSNCYYHPPTPYPPQPIPYPPQPTPYPPQPTPRPPQPTPYPPQPQPIPHPIGGCKGTIYGCCPDNVTAKQDNVGSNCSSYPPPNPPPPSPPNNNTCPTSEQGGNCTDTEYSCDSLFHGKIYSNYTGCSKGSYCCITPQ